MTNTRRHVRKSFASPQERCWCPNSHHFNNSLQEQQQTCLTNTFSLRRHKHYWWSMFIIRSALKWILTAEFCLKHGHDNAGAEECAAAACGEKQRHLQSTWQSCVLRHSSRCSSTEGDKPAHPSLSWNAAMLLTPCNAFSNKERHNLVHQRAELSHWGLLAFVGSQAKIKWRLKTSTKWWYCYSDTKMSSPFSFSFTYSSRWSIWLRQVTSFTDFA